MLKKPKPSQKGLKKLPTAVRNKMGYMKEGGRATLDLIKEKKAAYEEARKRKSSGRLSADDIKKVKEKMMEKGPSKFTAPSMASQVGGRLKKPMESVFQKLKMAQMMRKRKGK